MYIVFLLCLQSQRKRYFYPNNYNTSLAPMKYLFGVLLLLTLFCFSCSKAMAISTTAESPFTQRLSSPEDMDTLVLSIPDVAAAAGDTFTVAIRVRNFSQIASLQFDFRFDTMAMNFVGFGLGDFDPLGIGSFGFTNVDKGSLRFAWADFSDNAYSLDDNALLFYAEMEAKHDIATLLPYLSLSDEIIDLEYVNSDLEKGAVSLQVETLSSIVPIQKAFYLGACQPNPFRLKTGIPFKIPSAAKLLLQVYNGLGQLVWKREGRFPGGEGSFDVQLREQGIYFYTLHTPWGSQTRKMVSRP